jgi:hypothetical protein
MILHDITNYSRLIKVTTSVEKEERRRSDVPEPSKNIGESIIV